MSPSSSNMDASDAAARVAIYRGGWQILSTSIPQESRLFLERMFSEYDHFVALTEAQRLQGSTQYLRHKLQSEFQTHYSKLFEAQQKEMEKRQAVLAEAEAVVALKLKNLEAEAAALQEENAKMKQAQQEEHERVLMMSQAVVESRLSAVKAEDKARAATDQLERMKRAEGKQFDMMTDHTDMLRLLRLHRIAFTPKVRSGPE